MNILHLTLKKKWFDLTVSGEKKREYRSPSNWIKSRLIGKGYDAIKFVNGYGADKPYCIVEYKSFFRATDNMKATYSDGGVLEVPAGTFVIQIGDIIETGNLKHNPC